ncbi:unnamed protein product, partial [Ixodes persulcatus]
TTKPQTSPTTQAPTVPTTRPTITTTEPPTSPTTQAQTAPTTSFTTTTPKPEVSATTQTAKGTELRPKPSGSPTKTCSIDNCKPPKCTCMSEKPPGGLSVADMPQFVMLTFDDAVTKQNMQFYQELLGGLKRKNKASGCGIAATFFVSAEYLDYPRRCRRPSVIGQELAMAHNTDTSGSYWNGLDTESWEREVVDERTMVAKYANVSEEDIRGLRGPFFFTGGDAGLRMQHRHLDYDCTLIHKRDGPDDAPVFPYTLDYGFQKPCMVKDCPNDTYPGHWTVPLNYLFRKYKEEGVDKYGHCAMADACTPILESSDDTFQYLRDNFENFYTTNRAPFPVFLHEAWLKDKERKKGYLRFVDWLLEKEDVHLVTVSEVLNFMRDPRPRSSYAQRRCTKDLPESTCPKTRNCPYPKTTRGGERYMNVCGTTCPTNYPWINNPDGN